MGAIDRDRPGPGWEAGLMNGWSAVPSTESPKIYVRELDLVRLSFRYFIELASAQLSPLHCHMAPQKMRCVCCLPGL